MLFMFIQKGLAWLKTGCFLLSAHPLLYFQLIHYFALSSPITLLSAHPLLCSQLIHYFALSSSITLLSAHPLLCSQLTHCFALSSLNFSLSFNFRCLSSCSFSSSIFLCYTGSIGWSGTGEYLMVYWTRDCGATLKVVGLTGDSKWWG